MEVFLIFIAILFGVLQIMLFFKIWGMTSDVNKLVKHFCKEEETEKSSPTTTGDNNSNNNYYRGKQ